jgi:lysozyme
LAFVGDALNLDAVFRQLRAHEGLRLLPYTDTTGHVSIGYGRNLTDCGISATEADFLLSNDIERVVRELHREIPWWVSLDDVRQRVLVDLAFNVGIKGLLGFRRVLRALEARDYQGAADEMLFSTWATQVGPRALALAAMMATGHAE